MKVTTKNFICEITRNYERITCFTWLNPDLYPYQIDTESIHRLPLNWKKVPSFCRPHTVSTSVQVNGGRVGASSGRDGGPSHQETAEAATNVGTTHNSSSGHFPQHPVNFYTNSLYLATVPESPWTFYPQEQSSLTPPPCSKAIEVL